MPSESSHGGTPSSSGLDYLESLAPWRGQGGFGVEKLRRVMERLGNQQDRTKTVHVAGTNGKGSVSAAIASILGNSGGKVLLNTSPHLIKVNERICIDGAPVSDGELSAALERIRDCANGLGVSLSHFEAITGAAFLLCESCRIDWSVFEVGLGGRLDATNIIKAPEVTGIVSIDFDHEAILGDTLGKIACEKAGIIKPGVPVVVGKMAPEAEAEILRIASDRSASALVFGRDFSITRSSEGKVRFSSTNFGEMEFTPSLPGLHQAENMAVAAAMARKIGLPKEVKWPARLSFHKIGNRTVIFDSAHNPAGIQSLISFLDAKGISGIEIIFGAIGTKRWVEMVDLLRPYISYWRLLEPNSSDAVENRVIANHLSGFGISIQQLSDNHAEILDIFSGARSDVPILVTGSMYLVGKVMEILGVPIQRLWKRGAELAW
ncbi:MAG: hypothetical protein EBZ48_00415 [Proteobacteria bacterium]|nr:hypothetical protein [Pseudomonadota bacterium]